MTRKFCDRCGKPAGEKYAITPFEIEPSRWIDVTYDLCDDCAKELDKFLKRITEEDVNEQHRQGS